MGVWVKWETVISMKIFGVSDLNEKCVNYSRFIQYFHKKAARTAVKFLENKVKHRKIVINIIILDDFLKSVWLSEKSGKWRPRVSDCLTVWLKGGSPSVDTTTLSLGQNRVPGIPQWYPLGWLRSQKTPEMNELEPDKTFLKIWAHNFEKQKS